MLAASQDQVEQLKVELAATKQRADEIKTTSAHIVDECKRLTESL
jgi:hypothetical protein